MKELGVNNYLEINKKLINEDVYKRVCLFYVIFIV